MNHFNEDYLTECNYGAIVHLEISVFKQNIGRS